MKKRIFSLILALTICFGLSVPAFASEMFPFTDVSAEAWYRNDVAAAYATGLFKGTTGTTFEPNGSLTIAQAVTLAARTHQYTAEGTVTLKSGTDVWYSTFVDYAKENVIIGSEYDGRWGEKATRAEMVKILYPALPAAHYQAINEVEDNAIPDVKLNYTYGKEVYAFYRAGILTGSASTYKNVINGSGYFKPEDTIARSEVAAILKRMLNPDQRKEITLSLPELPRSSAPITEENVFAALDNLDSDGAWILRNADTKYSGVKYVNGEKINGPSNFMLWLVDGASSLNTAELDTAVHEECHSFFGAFLQRRVYIGDGKYITVVRTSTFKTEEMAAQLPEHLRTGRYNTYISTGASPSANQLGVYGLLNEFTAYCWGVNTSVKTYGWKGGNSYTNDYTNKFVSYAEFRFWILSYMLYARQNHPDVYWGILENAAFRRAFTSIDAKFAEVLQEYFAIRNIPASSYFKPEYDKLMAVMERPEYVEMAELLRP